MLKRRPERSEMAARTADLLDQMRPSIDATIASLEKVEFREDPIGGLEYSRATSIISSAYKRHGQILEQALCLRLKSCPYFSVWSEPEFAVSAAADHIVSSSTPEQCLSTNIPYGESVRTLQADILVYDKRANTLRAYEVKRGNGNFDAGKRRSILRDLLCTQVLLQSYGETKGFRVTVAEARIIFYYGICSLPKPFSLTGRELDDHFVFPVFDEMERVNMYFREKLCELLKHPT